MRRKFWITAGLLAAASWGCSDSATGTAGAGNRVGPHRGVLIALPGDKGYAEIVNSDPTRGKEVGKARPPVEVLVYLLNPGLDAALTASVTDVRVTLTTVSEKPESIALEPSSELKDPLGKVRFASRPGPFYLANSTGELTATVDGAPFKAAFDGGMQR